VRAVRFLSTRHRTQSASPTGGLPVAFGPAATATGPTSGRGRRLVLVKSVSQTGPTSVHSRFVIKYYNIHIKGYI
jgi:hypothetical protein